MKLTKINYACFGQLCNLSCDKLAKDIFVNRLTSYEDNPSIVHGFIPDICSILRKYSLLRVLEQYKQTGTFMSKFQWKQCIKINMCNYEQSRSREGSSNDTLSNYIDISSSPSILWTMAIENRSFLKMCRSTVKVIGQYFYSDYRRTSPN